MPGGLAERAVVAALHEGEPTGWVVTDRGDLLFSPGRSRNPRFHANRIARSSSGAGPRRDRTLSVAPCPSHFSIFSAARKDAMARAV